MALLAAAVWAFLEMSQAGAPFLALWTGIGLGSTLLCTLLAPALGVRYAARYLIFTFIGVWVVGSVALHIAGRRETGGYFLRYAGVLVERNQSFSIGVGPAGHQDVNLTSGDDASIRWATRVIWRGDSAFLELPRASSGLLVSTCEPTARSSRCPSESGWRIVSGAVLEPGQTIGVGAPDGTSIPLELRQSGGTLALQAGDAHYLLGGESDSLFARRALVRAGAPLALLRAPGAPISPVADFVHVRDLPAAEVRAESHVPAASGGRASWRSRLAIWLNCEVTGTGCGRRLIVTVDDPFHIAGQQAEPVPIARRMLVRVQAGTRGWRFVLDPQSSSVQDTSGLAVEFVRGPRPLIVPVTAVGSCAPTVACNVLSLRQLPPPTSFVFLGEAGPDTSRFGLLARVSQSGDSVALHLADRTLAIPLSWADAPALVPVPVVALAPGQTSRTGIHVLLGATRSVLGTSGTAFRAALAISLLLLGSILSLSKIANAVGSSDGRGSLLGQPLLLVAGGVISLCLARSVLGLRVALYAPFADNVAAASLGLWPVMAALLPLLLAPSFGGGADTHRMRFSLRGLKPWLNEAGTRVRVAADRSLRMYGAMPLIVLVAGLALLGTVEFGLLPRAALVVTAVLVLFWSAERMDAAAHSTPGGGAFARNVCPVVVLLGPVALVFLVTLYRALGLFIGGGLVSLAALAQWYLWGRRTFSSPKPALRAAIGPLVSLSAVSLLLRRDSTNAAAAHMFLALLVMLVTLRLAERARSDRGGGVITKFAVLALPLVGALPIAAIDMGLYLVFVVPLALAAYLIGGFFETPRVGNPQVAGVTRGRTLYGILAGGILATIVVLFVFRIAAPIGSDNWSRLPDARLTTTFETQRTFLGLENISFVRKGLDNLAARRVAVFAPEAAMRLAVLAPGGHAQATLVASVEQHWGTLAYVAGGGARGAGVGGAAIGGRGVPEAVSYAENTFAVYVLGEHGALGGAMLLAAYGIILIGAFWYVARLALQRKQWSRGLHIGVGALMIVVPAVYVAASNIGMLPITGQNMPLLGLNAWSDVLFSAGAIALIAKGAREGAAPQVSSPDRQSSLTNRTPRRLEAGERSL